MKEINPTIERGTAFWIVMVLSIAVVIGIWTSMKNDQQHFKDGVEERQKERNTFERNLYK